jgi:hypothetical protein
MIVEMETWHEMDIYVLCMLARKVRLAEKKAYADIDADLL